MIEHLFYRLQKFCQDHPKHLMLKTITNFNHFTIITPLIPILITLIIPLPLIPLLLKLTTTINLLIIIRALIFLDLFNLKYLLIFKVLLHQDKYFNQQLFPIFIP